MKQFAIAVILLTTTTFLFAQEGMKTVSGTPENSKPTAVAKVPITNEKLAQQQADKLEAAISLDAKQKTAAYNLILKYFEERGKWAELEKTDLPRFKAKMLEFNKNNEAQFRTTLSADQVKKLDAYEQANHE